MHHMLRRGLVNLDQTLAEGLVWNHEASCLCSMSSAQTKCSCRYHFAMPFVLHHRCDGISRPVFLACYMSGCASPQHSTLLKLLVTSTVLGVSLGCNIDRVHQYSDTLLQWVHRGLTFERDIIHLYLLLF